ncbi:hypothetical protein G6O67_004601 [Ophiocordyceps sinensis]|uniref:Uncharacterized protein n=1 Tax=Ophiocordyceps sinensis TaxID=72228 RepID=A0A8H4V4U5_9HYPO|nr:hypothetical protein G6O67_004601 [Ophiocordyceps sinensis]
MTPKLDGTAGKPIDISSQHHDKITIKSGGSLPLRSRGLVSNELGHERAVTVNMYCLAARRLVPDIPSEHGTVKEWNDAKTSLAQDAS